MNANAHYTIQSNTLNEEGTALRFVEPKSVFAAVLFAVYFEPVCITHFIEAGLYSSELAILHSAYSIIAIILSLLIIVYSIPRVKLDYRVMPIAILGLFGIASAIVNHDSALLAAMTRTAITTLGLACFVYNGLSQKNRDYFITGGFLFALIMTGCIVASVVFTSAQGFIPYRPTYTRIFFFGGKNSLFMVGIPMILLVYLREKCVSKNASLITACLIAIYAVIAIMVDSSSSTFFFILAFLLLLLIERLKKLPVFISGRAFAIIIAVCFFGLVVMQNEFEITSTLLEAFNRDATFTGRTRIWAQAIEYTSENLLFGVCNNAVYIINNLPTYNPHSWFLECMSRFGLLYFATIAIDIIVLVFRADKSSAKNSVRVFELLFMLLVAHSMFDTLLMSSFVLCRSIASCLLVDNIYEENA